jgi:2-polyprenyl-3-methyl-5-hydroxy-6-metoxy-1,4-benzoquinol methylase
METAGQTRQTSTYIRLVSEQIYIDGTYLTRNPTWHVEDSGWKAKQCYGLMAALEINPKTICDVGCGGGGVLAALRDPYPAAEMTGFDVSATAIELARRRHPDIQFKIGEVVGRYDVMLVIDVIEHIENCFGFTRKLRYHADLMLFHIPLELTCFSLLRNVPMAHRQALGHVHYFTKHTALALLADCGYEIVASRYTPAVVEFAARDLKSRMASWVQRAGFHLAPDLSTVIAGGYALLVAAQPLNPASSGE